MRKEHMKEYRIIAVDFDGTLCKDCYPQIGAPNLPLIELLGELKAKERKLILWTCRSGTLLQDALDWCREFRLEFDAVNDNLPEVIEQYQNNSRKIYADVYIDDKSCFPWESGREQEKKNNRKGE